MNTRIIAAAIALTTPFLAGCGGGAGAGFAPAAKMQLARVPMVVGFPAGAVTASFALISQIAVRRDVVLGKLPCSLTTLTCAGEIQAPKGGEDLAVTLEDRAGNVLADGHVPSDVTPRARSATFGVTFDPTVASVALGLAPNGNQARLSSGGPNSTPVQVIFTGPSGLRIIGDKPFVAASDPSCVSTTESPCVDVTLTDRDPDSLTSLSKTSFTNASSLTTTLSISATPPLPPFDVPVVSLSAPSGIATSAPLHVPLSPYVSNAMAPQNNSIGSGGVQNNPGMTSLYGQDALELNEWNGENAYLYSPSISDITSSIEGSAYGSTVCCNGVLAENSDYLDHLLGGISLASSSGNANSGDSVQWFADETSGYFSFADLTQSAPYYDEVTFPTANPISAAIVDPSKHIWFTTNDGQASTGPIVGEFDATNPTAGQAPNMLTLPVSQENGTVVGLTNGPSGDVYAVVSVPGTGSATKTFVDTLTLSNGNVVLTAHVLLTSGIDLAPNTTSGLFTTVGYTQADGSIYAANAAGLLYRINPGTGAWTQFAVNPGQAASASGDANRPPMSLLPDASLAYLGVPNIVHIIPGSSPTANSVPVACASPPCTYNLWSILSSGSAPNYDTIISSTNGGHTAFMSW